MIGALVPYEPIRIEILQHFSCLYGQYFILRTHFLSVQFFKNFFGNEDGTGFNGCNNKRIGNVGINQFGLAFLSDDKYAGMVDAIHHIINNHFFYGCSQRFE